MDSYNPVVVRFPLGLQTNKTVNTPTENVLTQVKKVHVVGKKLKFYMKDGNQQSNLVLGSVLFVYSIISSFCF